jgi:hypothetical protein
MIICDERGRLLLDMVQVIGGGGVVHVGWAGCLRSP